MSRYKIFLEKRAQRQLEGLNGETKTRIVEALHLLGNIGFSARFDLKKLRGYRGQYRLRVGRHRAIRTPAGKGDHRLCNTSEKESLPKLDMRF